mmetsp:Transcript_21923/g.35277  ORF Transcript_21923/g.35277 Transcript_21923/m.35277 type:complete len:212 (+) Transcript_21923:3-638(+)
MHQCIYKLLNILQFNTVKHDNNIMEVHPIQYSGISGITYTFAPSYGDALGLGSRPPPPPPAPPTPSVEEMRFLTVFDTAEHRYSMSLNPSPEVRLRHSSPGRQEQSSAFPGVHVSPRQSSTTGGEETGASVGKATAVGGEETGASVRSVVGTAVSSLLPNSSSTALPHGHQKLFGRKAPPTSARFSSTYTALASQTSKNNSANSMDDGIKW